MTSDASQPLTLNVRETIRLFDEISPNVTGHVSAIVDVMGEDLGAALVQHYFRHREGRDAWIAMKNGLPLSPTQGTKKGSRLDRWVVVEPTETAPRRVFQMEIKNWSATAIGGKELLFDSLS